MDNENFFGIDPVYAKVDPIGTPLCYDVWRDKYRYGNESYQEMFGRVATAIYAKDAGLNNYAHDTVARKAMEQNLWMPAGRILAGAGTPKRVTLLNCFVNAKLEDDMGSIATGVGNIMLTMQQGGGIGTDFTPLRPPGAILQRTGAVASGPGPFIDVWDTTCTTIRSAGDRRGAMMGTLGCWHPFLPEFIKAKQEKGRWTNFNVSVLITDAFMGAVEEDEEWSLYHSVPPAFERPQELIDKDFKDDSNTLQYVYSVHRARELWDSILQSTYVYSEPGVIFIDRVNDMNNLGYVEDIQCTNPCGEQPLPPHGCCDLGAVNIARMVKNPFTEDAEFDWELLRDITKIGVRFLDNVIDVTNYPLPEQREEQMAKRRIGVGLGGLADAMAFLGLRYGSPRSRDFAEKVMREICFASYRASIELAKEKGAFTWYDREQYLARPFIKNLPQDIQDGIAEHGIRNGVLLTIAPTGTTSIAYGNTSSGLEPVFAHSMRRKVRQGDGSFQPYDEVAFGARLYLAMHPGTSLADLPSYMNVAADVKVHEHVQIQEVCQRWVDASISKTINLPEEISYADFKDVYKLAYDSGLKGCTTYRPSEVRGSILSTGNEAASGDKPGGVESTLPTAVAERPEVIESRTAKIKWQGLSSSVFLTIGFVDGKPYEVFLNSKDQKANDWVMATTLLMSFCLRKGVPLETLADEFQQIVSTEGGWGDGPHGKKMYWPSLIAYLGFKMRTLLEPNIPTSSAPLEGAPSDQQDQIILHPGKATQVQEVYVNEVRGTKCPVCSMYAVINESGCDTCKSCGHSKCG